MSNTHIDPVKFVNIRTGKESIGFTLYDEYISAYFDCWKEIPEDDMEFFKQVAELSAGTSEGGRYDVLWDAFVYLRETEVDVFIGNQLYEYKDIKDIIDEAFQEHS